MSRQPIHSDAAPKAIGPYSQAIRAGDTVYLSGQIPLDPATMTLVEGGIEAQATRVFENLKAVAAAAGGTLREFKDHAERAFLVAKLRENAWNISKTAEVIDTPRSNLYKKLEQHQISQEKDGN